ncbi:MAG: type II toxin-antitoxin system mRNA interferase toxin, RelE/StbE family [Nitrospirae bacterium]|nr:type II toxin-antitoxin system mRNA interferase toxin, RelE/StbE family [Nitrospirota bacterium]
MRAHKSFIRKVNRLIRSVPGLKEKLSEVTETLQENPFASPLKTHRLSGNLRGMHSCSLTYEIRIIFKLEADVLYLLDVGSHDEVY